LAERGRQMPADQIVSELTGLGRSGASVAVEISGQPGGIIYLSNGRLAFAESPAVPDLGTRLVRSRRLAPDVWDQIARDSQPDGAVGAVLAGRGLVRPAELQRLLQSIALDALLALTTPFAGECSVTGIWFAPQRTHWAEMFLAMDVDSVRQYIEHMTLRLAWYDVTPRWCPQWSAPGRRRALVNAGQRTVAGLIDGRTTVSELAWRGGLSLHETMESVGQFMHAGLCTVTAADAGPGVPGEPAQAREPAQAGHFADSERPALAELPRRGQPAEAHAAQERATPLDLGLLNRVLQGLERMT